MERRSEEEERERRGRWDKETLLDNDFLLDFSRSSWRLILSVSSLPSSRSLERAFAKGMRTHWSERSSGSESIAIDESNSCVCSSSLSLSSLLLTVPVIIDISDEEDDLLVDEKLLELVGAGSSECECKNVEKEDVDDDDDVVDFVDPDDGGRRARRKMSVVLSSSDSLEEDEAAEGRNRRKGRDKEVGDDEDEDEDDESEEISEMCSSSSVVASSSARCQYSWASR